MSHQSELNYSSQFLNPGKNLAASVAAVMSQSGSQQIYTEVTETSAGNQEQEYLHSCMDVETQLILQQQQLQLYSLHEHGNLSVEPWSIQHPTQDGFPEPQRPLQSDTHQFI
ncbi:hypothetical protein Ciccas_003223 [Cichlidogyrus casuarinus]|uniref:Uncharacterized protein n=1 Tax=Cichlidogyrus casuarinus TaxID=1844966 RepID=A0ABD2QF05_9PLAT